MIFGGVSYAQMNRQTLTYAQCFPLSSIYIINGTDAQQMPRVFDGGVGSCTSEQGVGGVSVALNLIIAAAKTLLR